MMSNAFPIPSAPTQDVTLRAAELPAAIARAQRQTDRDHLFVMEGDELHHISGPHLPLAGLHGGSQVALKGRAGTVIAFIDQATTTP